MTIVTINQIIKMFSDFSDAHLQVNDFGYGPTSEIGTSRQMEFPYIWTTHRTGSVINTTNKTLIPELTFTFIVVDQINDQSNYLDINGVNSDNQQEILSDTFQISQDLITYISTSLGRYGVMLTEDSITIEPLFDETQDKVTGWIMDVNLKIKHSNCSYPIDGVEPVIPSNCPSVAVKNSDGSYSVTVSSGGELTLPDTTLTVNGDAYQVLPSVNNFDIVVRNTDGDIVGVPNGTEIEVPAAPAPKGIGYDRQLNLFTTSYRNYDDGWYRATAFDTYVFDPFTEEMAVQDPNDWFKLLTENAFGNYQRFTSEHGGYYDFGLAQYVTSGGTVTTFVDEFANGTLGVNGAGYVVDNLTGIGWLSKDNNHNVHWNDAQAYIQGTINASPLPAYFNLTDWKMPSALEALSVADMSVSGIRYNNEYFALYPTLTTTPYMLAPTTSVNGINGLNYLLRSRTVTTFNKYNLCRYHFGS